MPRRVPPVPLPPARPHASEGRARKAFPDIDKGPAKPRATARMKARVVARKGREGGGGGGANTTPPARPGPVGTSAGSRRRFAVVESREEIAGDGVGGVGAVVGRRRRARRCLIEARGGDVDEQLEEKGAGAAGEDGEVGDEGLVVVLERREVLVAAGFEPPPVAEEPVAHDAGREARSDSPGS